jgi:hypothetical protein
MLAVKQLDYELLKDESLKPVGVEISRDIKLVNVNKKGQAELSGREYKRRVDIVLKAVRQMIQSTVHLGIFGSK